MNPLLTAGARFPDATALALNALNLTLYRDRAAEWAAVRTRPWRGFARVRTSLPTA